MNLKRGGYKLKKSIRDANMSNDEIFNQHIMQLILDKTTKFKTISSDSLFSFVIEMQVSDEKSQFVDDDESPVKTFLFKICLIKPLVSSPNYSLEKKQPIKKHLLSEHDFEQEAFVQQKIWDQTMQFRLPDICSKLTNTVIIRDNDSATRIINSIFVEEPFKNYMLSEISKGNGLGVITMEPLTGIPLSDIPSEKYYECYIKILAVVLRLFFVHGVIHCDLHAGNNIFNLETRRVSALDFGRTLSADTLVEKINSHEGPQMLKKY